MVLVMSMLIVDVIKKYHFDLHTFMLLALNLISQASTDDAKGGVLKIRPEMILKHYRMAVGLARDTAKSVTTCPIYAPINCL